MPGGEAAFGPSELGRHPHTEVRFGSFGMIFDLGRWIKLLIHVSLAHELNSINFEFQKKTPFLGAVLFVNFQTLNLFFTFNNFPTDHMTKLVKRLFENMIHGQNKHFLILFQSL